jgi:hypothetical protein
MKRILTQILVLLLCAVGGGAAGMIIGALIGGNYATSFRFNGVQGYEAAGQLGLLLGIITGVIAGVLISRRCK